MASTTNPFENGAFNLEGNTKPPIKVGENQIPYQAQPYLKDKAWDQYTDPVVYQADKAFREWAFNMTNIKDWMNRRNNRKYSYSELFECIFGRPYDKKEDLRQVRKIRKIFAYYSSSIAKNHYSRKKGKWITKTEYLISTKCLNKPAYSLKLRLEELSLAGEIPDKKNMALPKDDLEPGHARNPKTEANKQRRAEIGRQAYNEYQKKQRRIRAEREAGKELGNS